MMKNRTVQGYKFYVFGLMCVMTLLTGCASNMKVPVRDPVVSSERYTAVATTATVPVYFDDRRTPQNKTAFVTGRIPMQVVTPDGKPFESATWLATKTMQEMVARGLPVQSTTDASSQDVVVFKTIHIENRRVSGFSPFETFTTSSVDVVTPNSTTRIVTFIKRGKVPVWSFDEVIDPTYSDPLDITAKELAAKLGIVLFNAKLDDAKVDALIAKTSGPKVNYRDVYELGFSNNPRSIPQLVKLTAHTDDEVHQAAFSALGILRDAQHVDLMIKQTEDPKADWEDRAVALAAIGDLNTPESRAYLTKTRAALAGKDDAESVRSNELIDLFLN